MTPYSRYNVHIYRYQNLVYFATLKCASTFYTTLLIDNGWNRITWDNIDWTNDHVFGFMLEPVKRWFKGLQQDIQNEESRSFANTAYQVIENYWSHSFLVTNHTLPITTALGHRAYQVDWIPLIDKDSNFAQLRKLCDKYGVTVEIGPNTDPHFSDGSKLLKQEHIERSFKHGNVMWELFLAKDIDLYQQVYNNFNAQGQTWNQTSWLNNVRKN
jgi:hypothetical protein